MANQHDIIMDVGEGRKGMMLSRLEVLKPPCSSDLSLKHQRCLAKSNLIYTSIKL